jgi:hypothetical protein
VSDDALIDAWLDGDGDDARSAELARRLVVDAGCARAFVLAARQDWYLRCIEREHAAAARAGVGTPSGRFIAPAPRRPSRPRRLAAGAGAGWRAVAIAVLAAAAIVVTVVALPRHPAAAAAPAGVRIAAGDGTDAAGRPLAPGATVPVGAALRAGAGGLRLTWADGSTLTLAPRTSAAMAAAKRLRLADGMVEAEVAKQPPGDLLVVETAHARATVIGTRFTVTADDERTRLAVTAGIVRFADLVAGGEHEVAAGGEREARAATAPPARGLALRLRGDDAEADAGGLVARWRDRSGHGRDAVAPAAAARPRRERAPAGAVVRFDGGRHLAFPLAVDGWTGMTIALVAACDEDRPDERSSRCAAVLWDETALWGNVYLSPFRSRVAWRFGTTQADNWPFWQRPAPTGALGVVIARKDGTVDELFVDGRRVQREAGRLPAIAACAATGWLGRGMPDDAGAPTWWKGSIAELLVYDRALDDGEVAGLAHALALRWGTPR